MTDKLVLLFGCELDEFLPVTFCIYWQTVLRHTVKSAFLGGLSSRSYNRSPHFGPLTINRGIGPQTNRQHSISRLHLLHTHLPTYNHVQA